jgi:hypothetical protein
LQRRYTGKNSLGETTLRFLFTLVVLLAASTAEAQHFTVILDQRGHCAVPATAATSHLTVTDTLPMPAKYPASTYTMTDKEFFQWATEFNGGQVADWEKRKAAIKEPEYIRGTETIVSGSSEGPGAGGSGLTTPAPLPGSQMDPYSGSDGYSRTSSFAQRSLTVERRWPNPYYVGPGPLTIVNPYCPPAP